MQEVDILHNRMQEAGMQFLSWVMHLTLSLIHILSKKDFDFMRQEGDIGSMDYDQAVKNGDIFFGWSTWMEQDGYAPGESIAFDLSLIHI